MKKKLASVKPLNSSFYSQHCSYPYHYYIPTPKNTTPTKHTYHCFMLPKSTTFTTISASIYNHNFFLWASTNVWPILNRPSSLTGVPHLIFYLFFALFWHVMMDRINVYYSMKHRHRQTQTSYTMLTQTCWNWTHMLVSSVSATWLLLGCCIKVLYEVVVVGVMWEWGDLIWLNKMVPVLLFPVNLLLGTW